MLPDRPIIFLVRICGFIQTQMVSLGLWRDLVCPHSIFKKNIAKLDSLANDQRNMKLVLIDGKKLAELMIQYEVGVQVKSTYRISKVDHDFFESF